MCGIFCSNDLNTFEVLEQANRKRGNFSTGFFYCYNKANYKILRTEGVFDFNEKTLPFIARYNKTIIGYIIGVPLEKFNNESWAHFDINLNKFNTLYTYAFVIQKKFRKKTGYSKTLKKIYINWAKKRGFKYITGHVKKQVSEKFKNTEIIKTFNVWYDCNEPFNYYRRKI